MRSIKEIVEFCMFNNHSYPLDQNLYICSAIRVALAEQMDELIDKAGAESGESSSGYEAEMAWKWLTQERAALESDK